MIEWRMNCDWEKITVLIKINKTLQVVYKYSVDVEVENN